MSDRNEKFFNLTNMPSELDEDCGTTWKESFESVVRGFRRNAHKCKNVVIYPDPPEEEPDIANALKTLCNTLDKTSGFIFWSYSVRSFFKLEVAPELDPAICFESFVFSDSHPPMLFIFTKTPSTREISAAPDLTTYRIGLAKALMSKLQYFTSDLICVLSVVVESGVHTAGELEVIVEKAENDARSTMSDKRLQMHERKYIGLIHAALAAIATTLTLQGYSGESSVQGEKYKILPYEAFTAVVECLSHRGESKVSAARAHGRKDLVAEIAWRHSLSKPTLLVSDDPPGEEHPARQSVSLDVVDFSSTPPLKEYACIVVDNVQNILGDKGSKWQNFLATLPSDKTAILIDDDVDTMTATSQKVWEDIKDTLLTSKICEEPFDQQERLPRVMPCIAKLDKGGQLSCPNCRQKIQVAGTFPMDTTRSALLDCTEVIETAQEAVCEGCDDDTKATSHCLDCNQNFCQGCCRYHQKVKATRDHVIVSLEEAARSPSLLLQKVEMCQKHPDRKLEFYCKTCKSATCSSCVISLHKDTDGHDNVELGVPSPAVTSSTILTLEFQLEPGRCRAQCTLWTDGKTLSNLHNPKSGGTGQSGPQPFPFLGTCGSVDLAQPAVHYRTVKFKVQKQAHAGDRCEFGLASLQTLDTCGEEQRISDHDVNSATLVVVREGNAVRVERRNWTKDVDTPQPPPCSDITYTCLWEIDMGRRPCSLTLGFLYDNRQPQSPRVLMVETESCRLLDVRRLSPSPDLRPVLRVWPASNDGGYGSTILHVETGPAALKDTSSWQLQSLLERMTDK